VHIPDGVLNNNFSRGMLCGTLFMLNYCLSRVLKTTTIPVGATGISGGNRSDIGFKISNFSNSNISEYFQKLAIIAMWIFAFQMFNVPVSSTISAHLIGGTFAAIIAGPFAGFLVMSSVLTVQSLFFADGGILALGVNIFNMAFVGSFVTYYVYNKLLSEKNYYLAILGACLFSVLAAAFFCLIELNISEIVCFTEIFEDMMKMHLIVALLESIVTLIFLKIFKSCNCNIKSIK
jgi:cobalt/nickel transport system permease protein